MTQDKNPTYSIINLKKDNYLKIALRKEICSSRSSAIYIRNMTLSYQHLGSHKREILEVRPGMNEWMNEWMNERMNERTNERTKERMNEGMYVRMYVCMYVCM